MNKLQRLILASGLVVTFLMLAFPPWISVYHFQRPFREIKDVLMERPAGYYPLWGNVPTNEAYLSQLFLMEVKPEQLQYFSVRLDTTRLTIQILAVLILTSLFLVLTKQRRL
jgi:hypothetical protein